mmetsp:Transcript_51955/g.96110  ORF Transcript_51955/g.96110 Transcript_51955/m.96110 type:complete len:262 (+) Transcript_51955:981-1766(+)
MLPVGAVSEIPLDCQDSFAHPLGILGLAETDNIGKSGVRLLVIVSEAEAATNTDIEAEQCVILNDSNEADAIGKDVHIIGRRNGHGNLVLPWKVGETIQWFLLHGRAAAHLHFLSHLVAMHEENLMVCAGTRQTMVVDGVCVLYNLVHDLAAASGGVGGAEHISAHIAASGNCVHAASVDGPHGLLHIPLQHTMQLPSLTRCDLERCICEFLANIIHGNPLFGCAESTRHAHADHEAEGILDAHLLAFLSHVSVVLLVAPM